MGARADVLAMNSALSHWFSKGPLAGLGAACARLGRRFVELLEIPTPEAEQLLRRVTKMERDIMLPVKAAGIVMLFISFSHGWFKLADELASFAEWIQHFLWFYYIPANVAIAAVLLGMRRLPLGLVQWVVFVSGLLDIVLVSALTVLTSGYQSFLYWLYPALIVRSSVSVPRATSQLALHFTIIACFILAGVIRLEISRSLAERARADDLDRRATELSSLRFRPGATNKAATLHSPPRSISSASNSAPRSAPTRRPSRPVADGVEEAGSDDLLSAATLAEPLFVRLALLALMSVCSYGVQVLFERQRKAEEEAREFAMREGQLHAAGRLAAEFAHQVKNPLAIINNAAFSLQRALKAGRPLPAEQVQIIQEEVEHSDRIITQIMGYAQLSEGRVEKLNVIEELENAIRLVFPPAAGFPVTIHRDYGPEFPPLLMLRRHVSETFLNLLQNAREALEGQRGNVYVSAHCRSDYSIEVVIRDDGPGIAPDKMRRIFEPYYSTKPKGTGLGLATVKHNVELYGGSVKVESELGKGARFILIFSARAMPRAARTT